MFPSCVKYYARDLVSYKIHCTCLNGVSKIFWLYRRWLEGRRRESFPTTNFSVSSCPSPLLWPHFIKGIVIENIRRVIASRYCEHQSCIKTTKCFMSIKRLKLILLDNEFEISFVEIVINFINRNRIFFCYTCFVLY